MQLTNTLWSLLLWIEAHLAFSIGRSHGNLWESLLQGGHVSLSLSFILWSGCFYQNHLVDGGDFNASLRQKGWLVAKLKMAFVAYGSI